MAIKYYTGNRFRSVRKEVTGNDPQNESIVDKCNFLVPLSELALWENSLRNLITKFNSIMLSGDRTFQANLRN